MELKKYLDILWRRKWVFFAFFLLTPLFTFFILELKVFTPTYKSMAEVVIKVSALPQQFVKNIPKGMGQFEYINKEYAIGTVQEILQGYPVIEGVIKELGIKDKKGNAFTYDAFLNPNSIKLIRKHKGVTIQNATDSEAFTITGYSSDPEEAKAISVLTVKKFSQLFSELYRKEATKARGVIQRRIASTLRQMSAAAETLALYKKKHNLYNTGVQVSQYVQDISKLEGQRVDLEISIAKLKTEKTLEHPDARALLNQVDSISKSITDKTKMLNDIPEKEAVLNNLSLEVDSLKSAYTDLAADLSAAISAELMDLQNVTLVSPPNEPSVYFPSEDSRTTYLVVATCLGLFLGLMAIFVIEYLALKPQEPYPVPMVET